MSDSQIGTYGYLPGTSAPLFLKQDDTYSWYRTDRLGVPHTLMETNGHVVWSGAYDAFGDCVVGVETVVSNLRLPGQYFDKETGLYYNLNRYYDPKIGRYLQPDPAGDGLNPYAYVGGNPVNAIDPLGLCAFRQVGPSGFWEGFIPVWGDAKDAIYNFHTGHPIWGAIHTGLAISDVVGAATLIKNFGKAVGKGAAWGVSKLFAREVGEELVEGALESEGTRISKKLLPKLFTDLQQVAPRIWYQYSDEATQFLERVNRINFEIGSPITSRILADEFQHALDFQQGLKGTWSIMQAMGQEGFDLSTRAGRLAGNRWWHRRIFTRALQNINAGTPGFRYLKPYMDEIYQGYRSSKVGGKLSLEEILSTTFEGFF